MSIRIESQAEPIPGYRLVKRLGGGTFGEVWKAEAPGGLLKAIKFIFGNLENVGDAARAEQELRALARVKTVRHPYILSLERYDIIDGQLVIVMELADRDLWDRFQECRKQGLRGIPRLELLGYLREAAEALDLMNAKYDLQHLDIKPQNLFLVHNHVKVADFGLVKDLEGRNATLTGGGTPAYAPPETFEGSVSRYCDQYSLAIVYQEMLTGVRPFNGTSPRQLILQHIQQPPQLESLPDADRPLVTRALEKQPDNRFPTCGDFIRALLNAEASATTGTPATTAAGNGRTPGPSPNPRYPTSPTPDTAAQRVPRSPMRKEQCGEGELVPALVIGLGALGIETVRQFRATLVSRFGDLAQLPHLRLLGIDTDPESAGRLAANGTGGDDVLLARLTGQSSVYLRSREMPPVDSWLDPRLIYKIDRRNPQTGGHRALGRLALMSNYRLIVNRLARDLEQVTAPGALDRAATHTGLKLRSDYPRVYVATALGGGTGSGMFVDVAYVVRSLLRGLGYARQDVVGLFLVPSVDAYVENAAAGRALANAHAALQELNHYSTAGVSFQAQYSTRSSVLQDAGPPFQRSYLVPLPDSAARGDGHATDQASGFLVREILAPLGRLAEQGRSVLEAGPVAALQVRSFGMHVLASPRRQLIRQSGAAVQVCRTLIESWLDTKAPQLATEIRAQLAAQLHHQRLDPEGVNAEFREACDLECRQIHGPAIDDLFAAWVEPIRTLPYPAVPTATAIRRALEQCDGLLGAIEEEAQWRPGRPPLVPTVLRGVNDRVFRRATPALTALAMRFLDEPGYRLGATAEVIDRTVETIEDWLREHEAEARRLSGRVQEIGVVLDGAIGDCERAGGRLTRTGRRDKLLNELVGRLAEYPRVRYALCVAQTMIKLYTTLRGHVADLRKELGYHRQRLQGLLQALKGPAWGTMAGSVEGGSGSGSGEFAALTEVLAQTIGGLTAADYAQLDAGTQTLIQARFRTFAQLCSATDARPVNEFQEEMIHEIESFLEQRLPRSDVVETFFGGHADRQALAAAVVDAFSKAAPPLVEESGAGRELFVVTVPDTPAGQMLLDTTRRAVPEATGGAAGNGEEVVFYRELLGHDFSELKVTGRLGREAYERVGALEGFSPHSRIDVPVWREFAP